MENNNNVRYSNKIVAGLLMLLTSIIVLLVNLNILGPFSDELRPVFMGLFGQSSYAIFIALGLVGISFIIDLNPKMSKSQILKYAFLIFLAICVINVITTRTLMKNNDVSLYLNNVYSNGENSAGGIINAFFLCLPLKLLGYTYTLILFILLFCVYLFFSFYYLFGEPASSIKTRNVKYKAKGASESNFEKIKNKTVKNDVKDNQNENRLFVTDINKKSRKDKSINPEKIDISYINKPLEQEQEEFNFNKDNTKDNSARQILFGDKYDLSTLKTELFTNKTENTKPSNVESAINFKETSRRGSIFNDFKVDEINESNNDNSGLNVINKEDGIPFKDFIKDKENNRNPVNDETINTEKPFNSIIDSARKLNNTRRKKITEDKKEIDNDNFIIKDESQNEVNDISDLKFSPFGNIVKDSDKSELNKNNDGNIFNDYKEDKENKANTDEETNKIDVDTDFKINSYNKLKSNVAETEVYKKPVSSRPYNPPPISILKNYPSAKGMSNELIQQKARALEQTLRDFKFDARVVSITKGPAIIRFELSVADGVQVNRIHSFQSNISMKLEADAVILAPIPGKNLIGIEVANTERSIIGFRQMIEDPEFNKNNDLTFALGQNITGKNYYCNITSMPHLLIAGTTNSGKSVCLNNIICSLIYKFSPDFVKFILVDPKKVELIPYSDIPHMLLKKTITDPEKALNALNWAINEMEERFLLFEKEKTVKKLEEYNEKYPNNRLPYIVIIVDELSDLLSYKKKDFENAIVRLAQKARASGIHLILATQRPSTDVITGLIKSNLPSRIAFTVSSNTDSRVILDSSGAEKLLGRGDMIYAPINDEQTRLQCAYLCNDEIDAITDYVKTHNESFFDQAVEDNINAAKETTNSVYDGDDNNLDPLFKDVLKTFIESNNPSISMIQRRFAIGQPRAARIMDIMELKGFVTKQDANNKVRKMLITMEDFNDLYGENNGN